MTQEEKQLLFKDLCARLPYGVKIKCGREILTLNVNWLQMFQYHLDEIKPYLRPMSSMTEDERKELRERFCYEWEESEVELMYYSIEIGDADCLIDWFLEHHLDFRGLIPKGLALEAPEGMYK